MYGGIRVRKSNRILELPPAPKDSQRDTKSDRSKTLLKVAGTLFSEIIIAESFTSKMAKREAVTQIKDINANPSSSLPNGASY